jgi:hypothetical protein
MLNISKSLDQSQDCIFKFAITNKKEKKFNV